MTVKKKAIKKHTTIVKKSKNTAHKAVKPSAKKKTTVKTKKESSKKIKPKKKKIVSFKKHIKKKLVNKKAKLVAKKKILKAKKVAQKKLKLKKKKLALLKKRLKKKLAKKKIAKARKAAKKEAKLKKKKLALLKKRLEKKLAKKKSKPIAKKIIPKKAQKELLSPQKVKEPKIVIPHIPPTAIYSDENALKTKVKTILISQPKPENEKNPYLELARKLNIKVDFRHFIRLEGITSREFRQQRVNLTEHNGIILTSRNAVNHFFRVCGEMRYNVPETTKYFCLNEATAYYLQKYIQYRKRKIFFGNGTISDLAESLQKNKEEHFLLPVADVHREEKIIDVLDLLKLRYKKAVIYHTLSADLSDYKGVLNYDLLVFFTPAGIKSLFKNFPDFIQGDIRIAAFGETTAAALREHKLRIDIAAPNPQSPSMVMALENYIREVNKR
ncbi:MAG: uroporphyrinogen-III synthase [Bacteroidia bacterium]